MSTTYQIQEGKLIACDSSSGTIVSVNEFDGCPVFKVLPLLDQEGCLILLDPGASNKPSFENLLRVNIDGSVVWRSPLPRSHDAYADLLSTEEGIEARTWHGVRVLVDPTNGKIHEIGFSK